MSETVQLVLILCITFIVITVMNNWKGWWKK
jgi:hypothetical protein